MSDPLPPGIKTKRLPGDAAESAVLLDGVKLGQVWSEGPGRWRYQDEAGGGNRGWDFAPTRSEAIHRLVERTRPARPA